MLCQAKIRQNSHKQLVIEVERVYAGLMISSHEQLVIEVKAILSGLLMAETKYVDTSKTIHVLMAMR